MKIIALILLASLLMHGAEKKVPTRFMGMEYELIEKKGIEPTLKIKVNTRSKSGKYTLKLSLTADGEILSGSVDGEHGGFRSYINAALKKSLTGKKMKKGIKLDAISKATSTTKSLQQVLEKSVIKVERLMKKLKLKPIEKKAPTIEKASK